MCNQKPPCTFLVGVITVCCVLSPLSSLFSHAPLVHFCIMNYALCIPALPFFLPLTRIITGRGGRAKRDDLDHSYLLRILLSHATVQTFPFRRVLECHLIQHLFEPFQHQHPSLMLHFFLVRPRCFRWLLQDYNVFSCFCMTLWFSTVVDILNTRISRFAHEPYLVVS